MLEAFKIVPSAEARYKFRMRIVATLVLCCSSALVSCGSRKPTGTSKPTGVPTKLATTIVNGQEVPITKEGFLETLMKDMPTCPTGSDWTSPGELNFDGWCARPDGTKQGPAKFSLADDMELEGSYLNGKKHGTWETSDAEGVVLQVEEFADGTLVKTAKWWQREKEACPPQAALKGSSPPDGYQAHCSLSDGKNHGPFAKWHKSGFLMEHGVFIEAQKHGLWTTWRADGAKSSQGVYRSGNKEGRWIHCEQDGNYRHESWAQGQLADKYASSDKPSRPGEVLVPDPVCVSGNQKTDAQIAKLELIWISGVKGKWEAWDKLRQAYTDGGKVEKLTQGSKKSVADGSPYWADYENYGNMVLVGSPNGATEALPIYDAGLKLAPKEYLLNEGRGVALLVLKQRPKAIKAFRAALAAAKDSDSKQSMYLMLAMLHHQEGNQKKANVYYRKLASSKVEGTLAAVCQLLTLENQIANSGSDANQDDFYTFMKKTSVSGILGVAAFQINQKKLTLARGLLKKLIDCGLSRQELTQFSLDKLAAQHRMKL